MIGYNPGDTLLIKNPREWDDRYHLYIIISDPSSDPDGLMLLPCLESLKDYHKDLSCILRIGDHPFIKHDSVVNYRDSVELTSTALDLLIQDKHVRIKSPLDAEVLDRVIDGARQSPNLNRHQKQMLPK